MITVLSLVFLFLLFPSHAFAKSNFSSAFSVNYAVNGNGITHTTFHIVLTNNTDQYYATSYTLQLGFTDMSNLSASDSDGNIVPLVKKTTDGEDVHFDFNKKAIGKGSTLPFTFSFDTRDIATQNGAIWEVNVPGLTSQNDFSDFTVHVSVPPSFGKATYMKPDVGSSNLTFGKDTLGKSGISLTFGQNQVFAFTLLYHLENSQLFPIRTEIALPPTTNYQNVAIQDISPKPTNVLLDADGNWLAQYSLLPSQKVTVTVTGNTFLYLHPGKETLTPENLKLFTAPQPYWESKNTQISKLAKQLQTPEAIYQYVVHTLHYDFSRVTDNQERLGALKVLSSPNSAVCLEFTDLFIALSRAAGIPAREIDGYAYTQNTKERPLSLVKEVLHAWPEYYDSVQHAWIMVDPTWENTTGGVDYFHTLDFDHMALVIKGASSSYPVPAGGYKTSTTKNVKDVHVSFSPDAILPSPQIQATTSLSDTLLAGFPIQTHVTLVNTGGVLFPTQDMLVETNVLTPHQQTIATFPIPPFGTTIVPISFSSTPFLTNEKGTVTIHIAGKSLVKSISVTPFSLQVLIIVSGGIVAIFIISVLIASTRPWRLFISK